MASISPSDSPSPDDDSVAENFVYAYARLKLRLTVEGDRISAYWLDTGAKLMISDEMAQTLYQEQQRTTELEAELARYKERFGELDGE